MRVIIITNANICALSVITADKSLLKVDPALIDVVLDACATGSIELARSMELKIAFL